MYCLKRSGCQYHSLTNLMYECVSNAPCEYKVSPADTQQLKVAIQLIRGLVDITEDCHNCNGYMRSQCVEFINSTTTVLPNERKNHDRTEIRSREG